MRHVFNIPKPFQVPDGTLVSPFLNSKDSESNLPFNLLDGFSIAAGIIEPRVKSKIHIMSHVTQVTFVRRGEIQVLMKGPNDPEPYCTSSKHLGHDGQFTKVIISGVD